MTKEEQIRHLAIRTNLLYVLADITETHLMELEQTFRRLSKIMRYDAKRDFNAAIRSIRRLKTDVNLCNDARQDEFGNDADIINALLLLILDRTGDDDLQAFRLYNAIKAMPSRLHMELDIDEASVFGHVLEKNEEEEQ